MFSASSVADLMTGVRGLTPGQEEYLKELRMREAGEFLSKAGKPLGLSPKMKEDLADLKVKETGEGFTMTETAKKKVEAQWLKNNYGYRNVVITYPMLKGLLVEQDCFALVQEVIGGEFRRKNRERFFSECGLLSGEPDDILPKDKVVEDVKASFDLRTFFEVRDFDLKYYGQGQAYLYLTGMDKFRLIYCIVDTPQEILMELEKKYFFMFGCDDDNPHYQEAAEQLRLNHVVSHRIPAEERVKVFEMDRDEEYIEEMIWRMKNAKPYYDSLKLNDLPEGRGMVQRVNVKNTEG